MLEHLLESVLSSVASVQRILYLSVFKPHFDERVKISGPHLQSMVKASVTWQAITTELHQVICNDFEDTREYSKIFRTYFPTYDFARQYSTDEFADQDHIANSKTIRQEMMQLKRWQDDLDRMKISNCCGIYHVDSKIMKNKLIVDKDEVGCECMFVHSCVCVYMCVCVRVYVCVLVYM